MALDPQFKEAVKTPKLCHGDIISIVEEQGLTSCDALLDHAQKLCRDSRDRRLLDFCVNLNRLCGVRTGLPRLVEVGASMARRSAEEANPPEHKRPLTQNRLSQLQALSRGAIAPGPGRVAAERIDRPHFCLDHYRAPGRFTVAPRDGRWSLRALYEVLAEGRADPVLAGLSLAAITEGGFSLPCSEVSWAEMQKPGGMGPNYYGQAMAGQPYAAVDKQQCAQELRFDRMPHQLIPWAAPDPNAWVEGLPKHPNFESVFCVEEFDLRAKFYVEAERVIALIRAFERAGHSVTHTVGIKFVPDAGWKVTAKLHKTTRHKHVCVPSPDAAAVPGGA